MTGVAVVIVTARGGADLRRAATSVAHQAFDGPIELVVVPDPVARPRPEVELPELGAVSARVHEAAGPWPADTSDRLAALRLSAVRATDRELVAFLDDDNVLAPNHLATLLARMESTGAACAHACRRLLDARGVPWMADRHPWAPVDDTTGGRAPIEALGRDGILQRGTGLLLDRARDRSGRPAMVDTSCWLFRRELLLEHASLASRTDEDRALRRTEDDLLLERLLSAGVRIVATGLPTVFYRLGGYSNLVG